MDVSLRHINLGLGLMRLTGLLNHAPNAVGVLQARCAIKLLSCGVVCVSSFNHYVQDAGGGSGGICY